MRRARSLPVAAAILASVAPAAAFTLARGGRAEAAIVVARDAIPAERTAAIELARYLSVAAQAEFRVVDEPQEGLRGSAVYVGPTDFATKRGIDVTSLGPEEWIVRAERDGLILCGGRPRGTLYAAYRFLEDSIGVHWWNPHEETVPRLPRIEVRGIDERGAPAFAYRDLHGIEGPVAFRARSRLNGDEQGLPWSLGGGIGRGTPWLVHSFYDLVPPGEFFESHPEYFAERAGFRSAGESQLCLTNPDVRRIMAEKVEAVAAQAEAQAAAAGVPPPVLYDVSQNDWGGYCRCAACLAAAARNGSQAGPIVEAVNEVAAVLGDRHPSARVMTLAYRYSFEPPRDARPLDNVIVRLAPYQKRDFSRPVTDPANDTFRRAVLGWAAITRHLWIWDYAVLFGVEAGLPYPSYRTYPADYRFYLEHGVEGIFVQHEFPVLADLRDLKVWLAAKFLEDPYRDLDRLVRGFTDGYYGRAASFVRRYLRLLEHAAESNPSFLDVNAEPWDYGFLDLDFVLAAHRLFDRAEASVSSHPVLLRRVRHARISLDFATLARWQALAREASSRGAGDRLRGLRRDEVAERLRETAREQVALRVPSYSRAEVLEGIESEIAGAMAGADAP